MAVLTCIGDRLRPDHGSSDPTNQIDLSEKKSNPTRPNKCMGQAQAKFFYPKPRKKLTQPNLEITHEKLDFTRPDPINDSRETRRWSQEENANNLGRACGYVRTCCTGSVRVPPLLGHF